PPHHHSSPTRRSSDLLNTATGRPAAGVAVALERDGNLVARGTTDADGRIKELAPSLAPGRYQLIFELAGGFFRRVALEIEIGSEDRKSTRLNSSHVAI